MITYDLSVTFTEPCLGTAPMSKELYTEFIATKRGGKGNGHVAPLSSEELAEELGTLPDDDKGKTGFHRLPDGTPMLYDYVIN